MSECYQTGIFSRKYCVRQMVCTVKIVYQSRSRIVFQGTIKEWLELAFIRRISRLCTYLFLFSQTRCGVSQIERFEVLKFFFFSEYAVCLSLKPKHYIQQILRKTPYCELFFLIQCLGNIENMFCIVSSLPIKGKY